MSQTLRYRGNVTYFNCIPKFVTKNKHTCFIRVYRGNFLAILHLSVKLRNNNNNVITFIIIVICQVINMNQFCWTTHIRSTWNSQFVQLAPQTSAPTNVYPRILSGIRMVASSCIVSTHLYITACNCAHLPSSGIFLDGPVFVHVVKKTPRFVESKI
jgi:hypothetical protein